MLPLKNMSRRSQYKTAQNRLKVTEANANMRAEGDQRYKAAAFSFSLGVCACFRCYLKKTVQEGQLIPVVVALVDVAVRRDRGDLGDRQL